MHRSDRLQTPSSKESLRQRFCRIDKPYVTILLAEVSGVDALLPRIIVCGECLPFGNWRVSVSPEDDEGRWIRILERLFSKALERLCAHCLRIRDDAMDHLTAEDIRLVLLCTADRVADRFGNKRENRQHQQQHPRRSPVFERCDMPART